MIDGSRRGRELGAVISGLQVAAGLLLLSVSAATSLAEERQRGSLDVLLATPLSTRSIVLGKWWGAFRGVPPLLVLPVLIAAALASHTGSLWGVADRRPGPRLRRRDHQPRPGPGHLAAPDGPGHRPDRRALHRRDDRAGSPLG